MLIIISSTRPPWCTHGLKVASRLTALLPNYYDAAHPYLPQDYRADVARCLSRPRSRVSSARQTVSRRRSGYSSAPTVLMFRTRSSRPCSSIHMICRTFSRGIRICRWSGRFASHCIGRPTPSSGWVRAATISATRAWLRGFEQVADAGLVWDLLVYDEQLPETHHLITSFPETTFVLEAIGWPLDLTAEGFSRWEERLRAVSEFPNVVLKLQGIALIFGTSLAAIGPWIRMAISIFGARRCMFATSLPHRPSAMGQPNHGVHHAGSPR